MAFLVALSVPFAVGAADTIPVPATANIFGAGRSAPPAADGGAGTAPPGITLPPAKYRVVTLSALSGEVTCCNTQSPALFNPYQGRADFRTNLGGVPGISGVKMRRAMALLGVFLGPAAPSGTPPTNALTARPAIGQVFYVGLRSPDGVPVEFVVPEGASRLFLGIADGYSFVGKPGWYGDNGGAFRATVAVAQLKEVSVASVSNKCGGEGWGQSVQQAIGNTSTFYDGGPLADSFLVSWVDACNLHDAGYGGAIVRDSINGGIVNYRGWSRREVDEKFLADMRALCRQRISVKRPTALSRCLGRGGTLSFGAVWMYEVVRKHGADFFDADPARPGTQSTGPRTND